jgi:hypothetical protein
MVMTSYRVLHKDSNDEGRYEDLDSPTQYQAVWDAAQKSSGGRLVGVYEIDANGAPVSSVPAGNPVE